MENIKKSQVTNDGGFTLIEIVLVTVIMSIIISITVPTYLGFAAESKKEICNAKRIQLQNFYEAHTILGHNSVNLLNEYIENSEQDICPNNGVITIDNNTVSCSIHN